MFAKPSPMHFPVRRAVLRWAVAFWSTSLVALFACTLAQAAPYEEVQRIGLRPMYEALVAVANCPDLAIDERNYRHAAALYHLSPEDLTPFGRFGPDIEFLAEFYKVRINDDRGAFCSSVRLEFAVLKGILRPSGYPALR